MSEAQDGAKLGIGDTVSMSVAMNKRRGGRNGQISGKPTPPKKRILFHTTQVQDGVKLGVGDTVSMISAMNTRTGERNGRRVRRLKEAPEGFRPQGEPDKPEFVAERNPNAVKYVGHKLVSCVTQSVLRRVVEMRWLDPLHLESAAHLQEPSCKIGFIVTVRQTATATAAL